VGKTTNALNRLGKPTDPIRKRITQGFREIRKEGFFARQRYWCCQSCGWSAASGEIAERREKGKVITGICFYHQQDTPDWDALQSDEVRARFLTGALAAHKSGAFVPTKPPGPPHDRWSSDSTKWRNYRDWEEAEAKRLCSVVDTRSIGSTRARGYLLATPSALRDELRKLWASNTIYLAFSNGDYDLDGDEEDRATVKAGHTVVAAMKRCGVDTVWNGTARTRIHIPLLQDAMRAPRKRRQKKVA
jgi:hypothetical protein